MRRIAPRIFVIARVLQEMLVRLLRLGRLALARAARAIGSRLPFAVVPGRRARALRDGEARARAILDTAVDGILTIDERGRILSANPATARLFGYPVSELLGRNVACLMPEPYRRNHDDYLRRYLETRIPHVIGIGREVRGLRKDGSVFPMELSVGEMVVDRKRVFTGIIHDISTRKQVEDALWAEKERAQVTLHSIGDGVLVTDGTGVVEYMNPVAETLTGWALAEATGRPLTDVFPIVDEITREPVSDLIGRCLAHDGPVSLPEQCLLLSRSGEERAIEDSIAPLRDRAGAVLGAVLVVHDVSETRNLARQLAHDAAHDALTRLVNRREFERRLENALASAHDDGIQHVVCFFDLDQFKLINDTAGHAAGDALLKQIGGVLAGKFRERDTLARLGGDEFGVLLEHCNLREAVRIAEVIVATFRDWRFRWQGQRFRVGASIGLAALTHATKSVQQLMSEADVACYTAKENGGGRVYVYRRDGIGPSASHGQILVAATLAQALEQNRFRLFSQPIRALRDVDETAGTQHFELLIRMLDDENSILLPQSFIPAAERFGLIVTIDRWVIANALQFYTERFGGSDDVEISVNLSAASLNTDGMATYVQDQFDRSGVSPDRVCFELTETATLYNIDQAKRFIDTLRSRGSRFAIDDFGSGHSSFQYLRALATDYLKIDGSFVENMIDSAQDDALVAAINEVGHTLGITTIAEFAHSPAIVDRLRELNVDYAQGYAVGSPVPVEQLH